MEGNKYRKINHHQQISPMCGGEEDIEQSSLSMVFQDNMGDPWGAPPRHITLWWDTGRQLGAGLLPSLRSSKRHHEF